MSTTAVIHPTYSVWSSTISQSWMRLSIYMTPSMCLPTVAAHTPTATRTQSMITRTPFVCTVSTGTAALTGVSMPTSFGIWHIGISFFGIPHGIVPTISTGISIHLIIMTPGTTPHGTIPGSMIPGTMIPGTTLHITTILTGMVRTIRMHTIMAPVADVTGE